MLGIRYVAPENRLHTNWVMTESTACLSDHLVTEYQTYTHKHNWVNIYTHTKHMSNCIYLCTHTIIRVLVKFIA